jgi:chromosome segregation ATPase
LSVPKDLEKLQAKRADLEAESRSLREEQKKLEYSIKVLEEQVVIEELSENNKSAKDAISQLEAKLNDLQKRLKQPSQAPQKSPENPAPPSPPQEAMAQVEVAAPPEKKEAPPEPAEVTLEDSEDTGVTVTAIDDEALVETQEAQGDKQQEKKKHRFF